MEGRGRFREGGVVSVKLGEFHSVLFSLSLSKPSFASTFFKVRVNSGLCGGDNSGAQLGLFFFFFFLISRGIIPDGPASSVPWNQAK